MTFLANKLGANKRFEFQSKAFGKDKFAVVEMEGFEAISRPFQFTLTLVTDDADIDFDTMLRMPATFSIFSHDGKREVPYHGVLAGFEQLHRVDGYVFYRAILVPRLWKLSQFRISEVYLNEQTIPAIVEGILHDVQLASGTDYELKLKGQYRPRSFVCQYQETHLDFISRWMEKEGMYYYFQHGDQDKLVIVDGKVEHDPATQDVSYRPVDELDAGMESDTVRTFMCRQTPLPRQVILQDYNHRKAALELKVQASVSENGLGDVMIYGENFRTQEEGNRYAKLRAEEILCGGKVFSGESTAVGLRAGFFMKLARHYRSAFNDKYLITEIRHEGSQAGALIGGGQSSINDAPEGKTHYSNSFRAIPASVQFRAERVTPKPRVAGTMNATVDAEGSGQYAELDEYGQYKVQLPFDMTKKDAAKGSARVRMATPYAGKGHGMHFPLLKNSEVLLSFTDGDPDQPVIVGAVPNSENRNVVGQDIQQYNRIATAGGNQIFMGDTQGKEVMWLHSPFHNSCIALGSIDPKGGGSILSSTVGSSDTITVGATNKFSVGSNFTLNASVDTAISAGVTSKFTVADNLAWSYTRDINWKGGEAYTIGFQDSWEYKENYKTHARKTVLITGGQLDAVATPAKALMKAIQKAAATSAAVNLLAGVASAAVLGKAADNNWDNGTPKDDGKIGVTTRSSYATIITQLGLAGVSSILVSAIIRNAVKALKIANVDEGYVGNIKVSDNGVNIWSRGLVPPTKGKIDVDPDKVYLRAESGAAPAALIKSELTMNPSNATLATSAQALSSTLTLDPTTGAELTVAAAGSINMEVTGLSTVQLKPSSVAIKHLAQKLELTDTEITASSFGTSVNLSTSGAKIANGSASVSVKIAGVTLSYGATNLTVDMTGARIKGTIIQVG
jgi:type VI secretion system secreted protein VgrG